MRHAALLVSGQARGTGRSRVVSGGAWRCTVGQGGAARASGAQRALRRRLALVSQRLGVVGKQHRQGEQRQHRRGARGWERRRLRRCEGGSRHARAGHSASGGERRNIEPMNTGFSGLLAHVRSIIYTATDVAWWDNTKHARKPSVEPRRLARRSRGRGGEGGGGGGGGGVHCPSGEQTTCHKVPHGACRPRVPTPAAISAAPRRCRRAYLRSDRTGPAGWGRTTRHPTRWPWRWSTPPG